MGIGKKKQLKGLLALLAMLLAFCAATAAFATPAPSKVLKEKHSDPDAVEALQKIYKTTFHLNELKADVNLVIQNEQFLKGFFDNSEGLSAVGIKGVMHYSNKTGCNLLLRREATEYNCFSLGRTVSYNGLRFVKRKRNSDVLRIEKIDGTVDSSPQASATPEGNEGEEGNKTEESLPPTPSPSPSPWGNNVDNEFACETIMGLLTPARSTASSEFPLSFVLPYVLNSRIHGRIYTIVDRNAHVGLQKCWEIRVTTPNNPNLTTRMWIDVAHNRIAQVQTRNNQTNIYETASYTGYYDADKKTGFSPYQRVEVSVNGIPVFFAELTEPKVNPATPVIEEPKVKEGQTFVHKNTIIHDNIMPFLSQQKLKLVLFLLFALLVLGVRYTIFITKRQEFSDEIMVIDEENGRFSETLNKLGYKVTPFSLEAISRERDFLGKGATKDTTNRPRSIIVAPMSFAEVRNHAFLIRAYVEEGGRVLVMNHPKRMEASFPYHAEMVPVPNVGVTVQTDSSIIAGVNDEMVRRLAGTYVTTEAYLKIDDKPLKPIVGLTNKLTNVTASAIGVVKQRKGEYLVCQMHITNSGLQSDRNLQILFNDVVRYLLGLDPLPYDDLEG